MAATAFDKLADRAMKWIAGNRTTRLSGGGVCFLVVIFAHPPALLYATPAGPLCQFWKPINGFPAIGSRGPGFNTSASE
jgi:hypothetical protein